MDTVFNDLLSLYGDITTIFNLKNKKIDVAYNGNTVIANQLPIHEYVEIISEIKELDKDSENNFLMFLQNLNPSDEPFILPLSYQNRDKSPLVLEIRGQKLEGDKLLLILKDFQRTIVDSRDSLTKVFTRDVIIEKVKEAIKQDKPFALMIVDIDYFKIFNDTYGHMYGDIILVETAASIKKFIENSGFVGRIGGDEFLVLKFVENEYSMLHESCRSIRQAIANVKNHNIKQAMITATVGCSCYPNDATTYDMLFKKADKALYRGKKKGRNCFIIYDESKCGAVTEEDFSEDETTQTTSFEQLYQSSTNANVIAGVFEILNRGGNTKRNIDDSLSLIGNYFLLDRIALVTLDPEKDSVNHMTEWVDPRKPENANLIFTGDSNVPKWRKCLDKTGMLKIIQIESNKNSPLYSLLKSQNTSAILAFEMKYMDKILGLIRFDMCSINRFWQPTNVSCLMLISKIFAIYLNKQYEIQQHKYELFHDKLTGIYNFTKWRDDVFLYLANAESKINYSLLYFNIDAFMNLNDIYGMNYCDKALVAVANGLQKILINDEIYCRVSEDKFLVFFPTQDTKYIEEKFNELGLYVDKAMKITKFKLFAGVYINENSEALITAVDKANLARKQPSDKIRNIHYFTMELFEEKKRKSELELHMHQALKSEEFLLYLQPKVNTETNEIVGAEALTRWFFKKEKIMTPNIFIPLFESNGFITELDYKVFENVCVFLRNIMNEGLEPIKISVNVSRYQKNFDKYIEKINSIRKKYNIDAKYIEIEITESMYIENISEISSFIQKLHKYGYKISMDDFGSGYSNLASLASLDFDLIKLDRGFCSNKENERENTILSFVMSLAKKLNMDVLCEGVETEEFANYLRTIGCTMAQGFLYERPIPSEEFKLKYLKKGEN